MIKDKLYPLFTLQDEPETPEEETPEKTGEGGEPEESSEEETVPGAEETEGTPEESGTSGEGEIVQPPSEGGENPEV